MNLAKAASRIIALLLILSLVSVLSACGNNETKGLMGLVHMATNGFSVDGEWSPEPLLDALGEPDPRPHGDSDSNVNSSYVWGYKNKQGGMYKRIDGSDSRAAVIYAGSKGNKIRRIRVSDCGEATMTEMRFEAFQKEADTPIEHATKKKNSENIDALPRIPYSELVEKYGEPAEITLRASRRGHESDGYELGISFIWSFTDDSGKTFICDMSGKAEVINGRLNIIPTRRVAYEYSPIE
jgi:predicted secreted protein